MSIPGHEAIGTTWRWRALAELADGFAFDRRWAADGSHLDVPWHRGWLPVAGADDVCLVLDLGRDRAPASTAPPPADYPHPRHPE